MKTAKGQGRKGHLSMMLLPVLLVLAAWTAAGAAMANPLGEFRRPETIPFPADAPYSREIATLGKMLFFDPRLSGGQNISCSSCHNPSFGWEAPVPGALGAANTPLSRHAPTIINAAWITPLFWDGRAVTLEEQAAGPITAPAEMNADFAGITARLGAVPQYQSAFQRLFPGEGITRNSVLAAIAMYERTIVSGESPFDRWVEGDPKAINPSAQRGFELFTGDAGCSACHSGWMFTDNRMHDIGLASDDLGQGALPGQSAARNHRFKTPGLRNIAVRAPYMHDGRLTSLRAVINQYAQGGAPGIGRSPDITPFELGVHGLDDLVAFLESLTDQTSIVPTPILPAN